MECKHVGIVRSFHIESTQYCFIGEPLEFHYFYRSGPGDIGAWTGKSNLRAVGQDLPLFHLSDLDDAFAQIADAKKKDARYLFGIVIDFHNHTVYHDNTEAVRRYFKNKFWKRDILTKQRYKKEWN